MIENDVSNKNKKMSPQEAFARMLACILVTWSLLGVQIFLGFGSFDWKMSMHSK